MVYPKKIAGRLENLRYTRSCVGSNAVGTEANFSCGSFVRFSLSIDIESTSVTDARFASNGCGYMLAAADVLAGGIIKKRLVDLHGLDDAELRECVRGGVGEIPAERRECVDACIKALHTAFADFRSRQIDEFQGEKALICTCFGVTEETIGRHIDESSLQTVDEVTKICNAGGGCGSCRMLIQEMLDTRTGP